MYGSRDGVIPLVIAATGVTRADHSDNARLANNATIRHTFAPIEMAHAAGVEEKEHIRETESSQTFILVCSLVRPRERHQTLQHLLL